MSWNGGDDSWGGAAKANGDDTGGDDTWNGGEPTGAGDTWGNGDAGPHTNGDDAAGGSGGGACRICNQDGHFARECPDKPAGGGLTGECFNCGEVGHNKADCTNPKVDRPFTGTCNSCGEEGHQSRNCPTNPVVCRLCKKDGHKAIDCKERIAIDWTGVPEIDAEEAWTALVNAANIKDLDAFRIALKAYARSLDDAFNLRDTEAALREDGLPIFLIAQKHEIPVNMTIVDLIGNRGCQYVLSIQLSAKPRRKKVAEGWPETPEENLKRLESAGFVQDCGVPLCGNCGELGHIRKHCKEEVTERESTTPAVQCVYCQETGHRARDCPKERVNPFACKNCKQEGHIAKDCPEPRSAENVECHKCNQMGHFSKDCPNVEKPACRNCGSTEHMAKECDQPRNPDTVTCRNCDKVGHFSRDCPEPKDWSKVKCSNCGEMGHTFKRCRQPAAEAADGGFGGEVSGEAAGSWNDAPAEETTAPSGDWDNANGNGW